MSKPFKFTSEEIVTCASQIVLREGLEKLSARTLAKKLGASTKVIFSSFNTIDEVKQSVIEKFIAFYEESMNRALKKPGLIYVNAGYEYITIAKRYPGIFKVLFMRDSSLDTKIYKDETIESILKIISDKSGVSLQDAAEVHRRYWFFIHGIAASIVTKFDNPEEQYIKEIIRDNYLATVKYIKEKKKEN